MEQYYPLLAKILFGLYCVVILGGGLMAVLSRSLVRAMIGLVLTLFGVAGMYLLVAAPFIALMQLLIYVGAVTVLIFFAIMLTSAPAGGEEQKPRLIRQGFLAFAAGIGPAVMLALICLKSPLVTTGLPTAVPIKVLGAQLMTNLVLAFELISVVLLIAMAGAVLLGWERRKKAK